MAKCRPSLSEAFDLRYCPEPNSGCWLWTGETDGGGYGAYVIAKRRLSDGGYRRERVKAHRLSWQLHRGPIPDGLEVCHRCDVPGCVNPDHLFVGTHRVNMDDRNAKGRNQVGSNRYNARVTEDDVRAIRSADATQRALAVRYGMSFQAINEICLRKTWKHVA